MSNIFFGKTSHDATMGLIEKLKQNYSLWNTVDKLYTVSSDVIFALCINYKNQLFPLFHLHY